MAVKRTKKVSGLIKAEIGQIIQTQIKDPLIGFVTITEVVVSPDLRNAKVYFTVLGDQSQKEKSLRGLERARTFIQGELGKRLTMRYLPVLRFYYDESWEYGANIDRLLYNLNNHESTNIE